MRKIAPASVIGVTLALLQPAYATVYSVDVTNGGIELSFLPSGEQVCRFSAVYLDNNRRGAIHMRLLRRPVGLGAPFSEDRELMAELVSMGAQEFVRRLTTTVIANRDIDANRYFYSFDLTVEGSPADLRVSGLQIDVRPKCPPA